MGGGGGEGVNDRDIPDEACVDSPDELAQGDSANYMMESIAYLRSRCIQRRNLSSSLLLIWKM